VHELGGVVSDPSIVRGLLSAGGFVLRVTVLAGHVGYGEQPGRVLAKGKVVFHVEQCITRYDRGSGELRGAGCSTWYSRVVWASGEMTCRPLSFFRERAFRW